MWLAMLALLVGAGPTATDADYLEGVVATAAAQQPGLDVLSAADVRAATAYEATKQSMGCNESASCLLELANALDADFVVTGALSLIDDEWVLQLNALNVKEARSAGRQLLRAPNIRALSEQTEVATRAMFASVQVPAGQRLRVVVLDFSVADRAVTNESGLGAGGFVVGGAGIALLAIGAALDASSIWLQQNTTGDRKLSAADAGSRYAASDALMWLAPVGYALGAVGVVAGTGWVLFDAVGPSAE